MMVDQCFAMNFRHGRGITHMDPRHGPLSSKSDPTLLNLLATALRGSLPEQKRFVNFTNLFLQSSGVCVCHMSHE